MNDRIKITELGEIRFRSRRYRDANGQEQVVQEQYRSYRPVNVITGWARFGHYLLDALFIWILQALVGFAIGYTIGVSGMQYREEDLGMRIGLSFVNMGVLFLYYTIFEVMYASTPAKMILGRIVIDEYALKPEPSKILLRSLSRLVPFEAFSCLGDRGWHDSWTKTFVVSKEEAEKLWTLLNQAENEKVQRQAEDYRGAQGPTV